MLYYIKLRSVGDTCGRRSWWSLWCLPLAPLIIRPILLGVEDDAKVTTSGSSRSNAIRFQRLPCVMLASTRRRWVFSWDHQERERVCCVRSNGRPPGWSQRLCRTRTVSWLHPFPLRWCGTGVGSAARQIINLWPSWSTPGRVDLESTKRLEVQSYRPSSVFETRCRLCFSLIPCTVHCWSTWLNRKFVTRSDAQKWRNYTVSW